MNQAVATIVFGKVNFTVWRYGYIVRMQEICFGIGLRQQG